MKDQSIVSQAAGLVEEKMEALGLSHRVDVAITYDPDSNKNIVRATTTEGEDRFNRRYLDLVILKCSKPGLIVKRLRHPICGSLIKS